MSVQTQSVKTILESNLSRREKLVTLRNLENELRQRSAAEQEGMSGAVDNAASRATAYQTVREARHRLRDPELDPTGEELHDDPENRR